MGKGQVKAHCGHVMAEWDTHRLCPSCRSCEREHPCEICDMWTSEMWVSHESRRTYKSRPKTSSASASGSVRGPSPPPPPPNHSWFGSHHPSGHRRSFHLHSSRGWWGGEGARLPHPSSHRRRRCLRALCRRFCHPRSWRVVPTRRVQFLSPPSGGPL